jgi:hypothetical protein
MKNKNIKNIIKKQYQRQNNNNKEFMIMSREEMI